MTDLMTYAQFQLGDGTAQSGERILAHETLTLMRTAGAQAKHR